jgi:dihydroneopterin aldolase
MGTITLQNMEFFAHHGCFDEERVTGTYFSVDIAIEADLRKPAQSDNLSDAIDYQWVYAVVKQEMQKPSKLLENVAGRILQALHQGNKNLGSVTVSIRKHNPALGGKVGCAAVSMRQ